MLDECKGERLEEILAVFSHAVLKRVLQENGPAPQALAQQLALENFSYSGERSLLSSLILAHKASLSKHLGEKDASRAQYQDFLNLLDLNERRIARRHEQLKQVVGEHGAHNQIPAKEITALQLRVQKNWSGAEQWLDTILYGDSTTNMDSVLATPFEKLWKHVENGSLSDIEGKKHVGLLDQLEVRVRDQEARLARWQSFGKTLKNSVSPSKSKDQVTTNGAKIDLGFTRHQSLQLPRKESTSMTDAASTEPLEEYCQIVNNMKAELANARKPQRIKGVAARKRSTPDIVSSPAPTPTSHSPVLEPLVVASPSFTGQNLQDQDEDWTSASEVEEDLPTRSTVVNKTRGQSTYPLTSNKSKDPATAGITLQNTDDPINSKINSKINSQQYDSRERDQPNPPAAAPRPRSQSPAPIQVPTKLATATEESILADQILDSVSASSPSPKKRHTLSLAERTRLSMSRASHSKYSELHDEFDNIADLPRLSIKPTAQAERKAAADPDTERHADLISRTRKSMAGFEAAQKKAQVERRRSVKDAKKKQRESSYFPRVEEEPVTPSLDPVELIEGDPDYESVFKSRPKIATSPALSPTRIWEDENED